MRLVDVYLYKKEHDKVNHLIFKRASDVIYARQWRMIGGKVKENEKAYEAARRELKEETALTPTNFWSIPSLNSFYDYQTDTLHHIPAFAAEVPFKTPKLNHEHTEFKWIDSEEICQYIVWPKQQRLMQLLTSIIMNNQLIDEWIIKEI